MSKFTVILSDFSKVQEIASLAKSIETAIDNEENCDELLAQMSLLTQCKLYDRDFFANLYKHTDIEDFAASAGYPPPKKIPEVSRNDLIEIMELAMNNIVESSFEYYLDLFDTNVVMPGASNVLFHLPDDWPYSNDEPSAEEIVDYVLSYKVIAL